MGFFDFFKSSNKKGAQSENIDEIFDLASKDIAYRPLFYRIILEKELYVLIYHDDNLPVGKFISDEKTTLQVRTLADGKIPIFTSVDKIFDNGVIKEQVNYVTMKGKVIFDMFKEPPIILLNPYSRPSKEFLPDEIKKIREGELFKPDEEHTIKAGVNISLGIPANYPTELVGTLKKYCDTRVEVKAAYLGLMHDSSSKEAPHLLVGLDITNNAKEIFGEVGETIRAHIPEGEPVDMINVSDGGEIVKFLKQKQYKVY
jgi:hypothetical protein